MKTSKKITVTLLSLLLLIVLIIAGAFGRMTLRFSRIDNDYSAVYADPRYAEAVLVEGVELVKQEHTCGYAVIEMYSNWSGNPVTEEQLIAEHDGKIVTSTNKSFAREMNRQMPASETIMHSGLTNTEMIELIYGSLSAGRPVPIVWAALLEDEWTLHYSLVTALDIQSDNITIANPYGYMEKIGIDEFLDRTRFDSYEGMPLFIRFGFAFGVFDYNTLFLG